MKFKVGDRVRILDLDHFDDDRGKIATIREVDDNGWIFLNMIDGAWREHCFEPETVKDDNKMSDTIKIEVELKKCWVRVHEQDEWSPRWNIADTEYCVNDVEHSEIPRNILYTTKWSYMTFDDPNIKQMTQAEIEKELGYKIKIVGE